MQFSVAGIAVSGALIMLMLAMRAGTIAVLIGSLAFGSTAIATLGFLGGASPLVNVVFTLGLFMAAFLSRDSLRRLGSVFISIKISWVVLIFMIYAVFSALIFPRLFAGSTSVFVASREMGGVFETPLAPVSGNISQAGYFVLDSTAFFAACILLTRRFRLDDVARGFFLWGWINAGLGMIDMFGKYSGLGDVLAPIRSATYAMLTNVEESGFARITGGFSEASAFGTVSLACLAFSFTYWRRQKTRQSFWLTVITFFLLLASTSSAAYGGLAVLSLGVAYSIVRRMASRVISHVDLFVVSVFLVGLTAILATSVVRPQILAPATNLINSVIFEKSQSQSAIERTYWNTKSIEAVGATNGVGVGLGSSRASSWPIAVLSQLGIAGFLMTVVLTGVIVRGMRGIPGRLEPAADATLASVRACAIASMVTATLIGGNADPGIVFFVALAAIAVSRVYVLENVRVSATATATAYMPRWPWPALNNA